MEGQTEEGKQKKHSRTNNDLQNSTQKSKGRATQTSLKPEVKSGALKGLAIPAPFSLVVTVVIERCHSNCNLEMEK